MEHSYPWVWFSSCSWMLMGQQWTENQIYTPRELIFVGDLWEPRHFLREDTVTSTDVIWIWKGAIIKEAGLLSSAPVALSCHPAPLGDGLPPGAVWASTGGSSWGLQTAPVLPFQECVGAAALRWHFPLLTAVEGAWPSEWEFCVKVVGEPEPLGNQGGRAH